MHHDTHHILHRCRALHGRDHVLFTTRIEWLSQRPRGDHGGMLGGDPLGEHIDRSGFRGLVFDILEIAGQVEN